ncbi:MAG: T9SS type A sorting domain-containing protein [Algicola sp.]|nr:T9SS type A sorting domain-containing protein [Algicola sp.]
MKKNYLRISLLMLFIFGITTAFFNAQVRIVEVDPATERATIKNFGASMLDISTYRLCSKIKYGTLSNMTVVSGSLQLMPNAEVSVTVALSGGNALDAQADLGLYLPTGSFGTAANMIDFTQWGSGGNGRENLAVQNGFWTAGTFINVSPPYEFTGTVTDYGVAFWDTLLGVEDINDNTKFSISPNPATLNLNISIPSNIEDATLRVFDLLGKKVLETTLSNLSSISIDVSDWNTGIYIVRVANNDISQTKRFIKQ